MSFGQETTYDAQLSHVESFYFWNLIEFPYFKPHPAKENLSSDQNPGWFGYIMD